MEKIHKLLKRQLSQEGIEALEESYSAEQWEKLMQRVNKSYYENDKYVYLLERSAFLSHQELQSLHQELEERREKLEAIMSDGLCFLDGNYCIESVNAKAQSIFNLKEYKGERLFDLVEIFVDPEQDIQLVPETLDEKMMGGEPYFVKEAKIKNVEGGEFQAMIAFNPIIKSDTLIGSVLVFRDESEHKKDKRLTSFDSLTGLPNRNVFEEQLRHAISMAKRHKHQVALLFVDLDNFKMVNDNYRHEIGDLILKEVAGRLKECLREADTVARIGGDEFTVLLYSLVECEHAAVVAEKIIDKVKMPYKIQDTVIDVGCSIGIACCPASTKNLTDLLSYADAAMNQSKKSGGNCYTFFQTNMLLKKKNP